MNRQFEKWGRRGLAVFAAACMLILSQGAFAGNWPVVKVEPKTDPPPVGNDQPSPVSVPGPTDSTPPIEGGAPPPDETTPPINEQDPPPPAETPVGNPDPADPVSAESPEPGTIGLALVASGMAGAAAWRKRRRATAV